MTEDIVYPFDCVTRPIADDNLWIVKDDATIEHVAEFLLSHDLPVTVWLKWRNDDFVFTGRGQRRQFALGLCVASRLRVNNVSHPASESDVRKG